MKFAHILVVLAAVLATPASAYFCEAGGVPVEASCGGDTCQCAAACTTNEQCVSGCCSQGYCAIACVCAGEGTQTVNCQNATGCSAASTASPADTASAMPLGLVLLSLGFIAGARTLRGGGAGLTRVAALSLALLGSAFVLAAAVAEPAPIAAAKSLRH